MDSCIQVAREQNQPHARVERQLHANWSKMHAHPSSGLARSSDWGHWPEVTQVHAGYRLKSHECCLQAALNRTVQLLLKFLAFSFGLCGLLVRLPEQDLLLLYCSLHDRTRANCVRGAVDFWSRRVCDAVTHWRLIS